MSIDVERLDNRGFQDIVDEAKQRITEHCPRWTNHNISDPGVALIELFAWMTSMTLFQLNQLPQREMKVLLNTIGFELFPAQAATVDLTFRLATGKRTDVVVKRETKVAAPLDGQVFETVEDLVLTQPTFSTWARAMADGTTELATDVEDGRAALGDDFRCFDGIEAARAQWDAEYLAEQPEARVYWRPADRFDGDATYFGFEAPLTRLLLRADIEVGSADGLGIRPDRPPLIWECSTATGWARCDWFDDSTDGLNATGSVDVQIGADHQPRPLDASPPLHWLRMRVDVHDRERPVYIKSPVLTAVEFSVVGGAVQAINAALHDRVAIGMSDGSPGQRFTLDRPVIGGGRPPEVHVGGSTWRKVGDFSGADESSHVFVVDEAAGEIVFGPRVHHAEGPPRQHGAIPRDGELIAATYRRGGGREGNVGAHRITNLQTALEVDSVTNRSPATGGVDPESLEDALARAPIAVRAGERAVTASDYERIVRDADRDLHTVRCRPPTASGMPVRILVVPGVTGPPIEQTIDSFSLTPRLRDRIVDHLEPRRLLGVKVEVTTPFYLGLSIVVRFRRANANLSSRAVSEAVRTELYRFVNPVVGGERRAGLGFDETVTADRIRDVVGDVHGVGVVDDVAMFEVDLRNSQRLRTPHTSLTLPADTMFLSFGHHAVDAGATL